MAKKTNQKNTIQKKAKDEYRHGDLKNVLLLAAIQLIDQRKEVAFTIRELAAMAGVTHTAAYRHYKSKKEMLVAIATAGFKKLQLAFDEALLETSNKKLSSTVRLGIAYVHFAIENPTHFRVMFHPDLNDCFNSEDLQLVGSQTYQTLVKSIEANRAQGLYRQTDPEIMSLSAWSMVHGMSTLYINGLLDRGAPPPRAEVKKWAEASCLILEMGLLA